MGNCTSYSISDTLHCAILGSCETVEESETIDISHFALKDILGSGNNSYTIV